MTRRMVRKRQLPVYLSVWGNDRGTSSLHFFTLLLCSCGQHGEKDKKRKANVRRTLPTHEDGLEHRSGIWEVRVPFPRICKSHFPPSDSLAVWKCFQMLPVVLITLPKGRRKGESRGRVCDAHEAASYGRCTPPGCLPVGLTPATPDSEVTLPVGSFCL